MCEPLLEPRIWDIISRVQSEIKNAKITLASNLSLLNERHIEKLIRISIMNSMNISLNDYRPDAYKKIMGLDFSRTVANIKKLHELKERGKLNFRIVISRVADGTEHDSLFLKWCHEKFPLFPAAVAPRIDWLGGVESNLKYKVPNIGCPNWTTMSITYSGIVNLCCCDYKNDYIYGDANKQHILEIYNNTAYRNFRENVLSRLEVEPCRRCVSIAEPPLKYEDIQ
jgi:hypothetical protein